jgi:hypothetical protein
MAPSRSTEHDNRMPSPSSLSARKRHRLWYRLRQLPVCRSVHRHRASRRCRIPGVRLWCCTAAVPEHVLVWHPGWSLTWTATWGGWLFDILVGDYAA